MILKKILFIIFTVFCIFLVYADIALEPIIIKEKQNMNYKILET